MIPSKKKKVHQRVHHYTLSTTKYCMNVSVSICHFERSEKSLCRRRRDLVRWELLQAKRLPKTNLLIFNDKKQIFWWYNKCGHFYFGFQYDS